jgi:hypothetical protein
VSRDVGDVGAVGEEEDVTAVVAFLLLVVMLVIGSRFHGVRSSPWKLLAFGWTGILSG